MNYTPNYQLPQWEKTDRIMMEDFNESNQKIEAGLEEKAEILTGTYIGNGAATRSINLGFQPKALYLCEQNGAAGYISGARYICGGLALPGHPIINTSQGNYVAVEITSTGFTLHHDEYRAVNTNGGRYHYLVLR